ncbi:MAG: hypothetical protein ACPGTO_02385 [Polaribacter sp.]
MKKLFDTYIKNNLGLINLFGKSFGRILFLLLTSFFAYKLSVEDFAAFAIFWSSLRLFTFFSVNNLYIIYFNEVRENLIDYKKWPIKISSNIIFNAIIFSVISVILSAIIFDNIVIIILMTPSILLFIIIRNISEFSKADNSLNLYIFIEDFLFYFLFFVFGVLAIFTANNLTTIIMALFLTLLITAIASLILFKRKFNFQIKKINIRYNHFSFTNFKLGVNYTFLRGNDFFSNFGVRYLGQIYFGDFFVAYTHIMYQFYNIFSLITIAVISGLQSKITVKNISNFHKTFVKSTYLKILKTIAPFIGVGIIIIVFFNSQILEWFFPKYVQYDELLVKVSFIGFIFMFIQPLVLILLYNNKFFNIKALNFTQYIVMFILYMLPFVFPKFNEQYWLLTVMTAFIIIQGFFAVLNYKKIR